MMKIYSKIHLMILVMHHILLFSYIYLVKGKKNDFSVSENDTYFGMEGVDWNDLDLILSYFFVFIY